MGITLSKIDNLYRSRQKSRSVCSFSAPFFLLFFPASSFSSHSFLYLLFFAIVFVIDCAHLQCRLKLSKCGLDSESMAEIVGSLSKTPRQNFSLDLSANKVRRLCCKFLSLSPSLHLFFHGSKNLPLPLQQREGFFVPYVGAYVVRRYLVPL